MFNSSDDAFSYEVSVELTVGIVDIPPAPMERAVTAQSHLLLPLPLTGERLLFAGQKSRRPRSKRTRASASIFSFPWRMGHDFDGNFFAGWVPAGCSQQTIIEVIGPCARDSKKKKCSKQVHN